MSLSVRPLGFSFEAPPTPLCAGSASCPELAAAAQLSMRGSSARAAHDRACGRGGAPLEPV